MPNSLLEAMASGLPAIAFAIPAVEELEAGTGSLIKVDPFDVKLFSEALLKLSRSPGQRKWLGEKAKSHVKERFDINKNMARAVEKIAKIIDL